MTPWKDCNCLVDSIKQTFAAFIQMKNPLPAKGLKFFTGPGSGGL